MADKIRGITIEIGGDTSDLTKSLKDANKQISSTQKELKDVDKLLKLDPTNVELLEQKQKLLADQIGNTNSKLEELKSIQQNMDENGVDENSEQYMALRREIIDTENKLNVLTQAAEDNQSALDGVGDSAGDAESGLDNVGNASDSASDSFSAAEVAVGNLISKGIEKLVSACADAVTGMFALADNVNTLSNNYGISREAAYELTQMQELLDYSVSGVTRMMKEQYKELAEGTDKYDELGIAVRDASGEMLTQEEIWLNTIQYLRDIDDPVERASQGVELLGNKYYELGGILNASEDSFNDFRDGVLGENDALVENLDGLQEFKDMVDGAKVALQNVAVSLGKVFGKLSQLQGIIPAITVLVAGLATAWLVMGGAETIIESVTAAMTALNVVLAANPIGIIIIAVTALVAAFILLWRNCEGFRNFFINAWNNIKNTAVNTWNAISKFAQSAVNGLRNAWSGIVGFFSNIWTNVKNVFSNAVGIGKKIVDDIKQGIANAWGALTGWFKDIWNKLTGNLTARVRIEEENNDGTGATGISYVPYSGYNAILHRGEMVLTSSEARDYRSGAAGSNVINLNITAQDLSEAQIDYIVGRVNVALGGA